MGDPTLVPARAGPALEEQWLRKEVTLSLWRDLPMCEDGLRAQSPYGPCSSLTLLPQLPREGGTVLTSGALSTGAALQHRGQWHGPRACLGEGCLPSSPLTAQLTGTGAPPGPTSGNPPGVLEQAQAFQGGAPTGVSPQLLHTSSEVSNWFVLLLPPIGTRLKMPLNFCQCLKNVTIRHFILSLQALIKLREGQILVITYHENQRVQVT